MIHITLPLTGGIYAQYYVEREGQPGISRL